MASPERTGKITVIYWQCLGFFLAMVLLWLDEILDLPHLLMGAPATPVNWVESLLESAFVGVLGAIVLTKSSRALRRIRYLEEFLRVCPSCKRVQSGGVWMPLDQYFAEQTDVRVLRGLCPNCEQNPPGSSIG